MQRKIFTSSLLTIMLMSFVSCGPKKMPVSEWLASSEGDTVFLKEPMKEWNIGDTLKYYKDGKLFLSGSITGDTLYEGDICPLFYVKTVSCEIFDDLYDRIRSGQQVRIFNQINEENAKTAIHLADTRKEREEAYKQYRAIMFENDSIELDGKTAEFEMSLHLQECDLCKEMGNVSPAK